MSDLFGDDDGSKKADDFGAMLEQSIKSRDRRFEKGQKVKAEVITVGRDNIFVLVDGFEGVVDRAEFKKGSEETLPEIGEEIDLYVIKPSNTLLELTPKISSRAMSDNLEDAFDLETPVSGRVTEVVNGGFRVEIMGKLAFCPLSQMDFKVLDAQSYLNQRFDFLITKFEEKGRNIVVSRRRFLELSKAENEGQFLLNHKLGDLMDGEVTRIEAFGAFMRISDSVEGLLHISELSWSRVGHPSEVVSVGQKLTVKIIRMDEEADGRLKISLSRKQVEQDPWNDAAEQLKSGQVFEGTIRSVERFGFLIEIKPGLVGLLPRSALKQVPNEKEIEAKKPGEKMKIVVREVRLAEKRISLDLPSEQDDSSWQEFSAGEKKSNFGSAFGNLADQMKNVGMKTKK